MRNYIPNALSLSRIPVALLIVLAFTPVNRARFYVCLAALLFALLTDVIDGKLARAWNVSNDFGSYLDGLCDKIIYSALLVVIAREWPSQILLPWLLIIREILLYALRSLDDTPSDTRRLLRPLSLTYALFVRLYFLGFLLLIWRRVESLPAEPQLEYFSFAGLIAVLLGGVHLFLTSRSMEKKL